MNKSTSTHRIDMKIAIYKDEAYPVYTVTLLPDSTVTGKHVRSAKVTEAFYTRYVDAMAEYALVQDRLAQLCGDED
jgi:hypothetical protein